MKGTFPWRFEPAEIGKAYDYQPGRSSSGAILEAGIPLLQALEIMTFHQEKSTDQLEQWKTIKGRVEEGSDLSEAMSLLNPPPNSFVLSMIKAGEYTGTLGKVLSEVADETDQDFGYQKKIKAALAYPLFLLFAVVLSLIHISE